MPNIFDEIHAEKQGKPAGGGNIFDQIHAEQGGGAPAAQQQSSGGGVMAQVGEGISHFFKGLNPVAMVTGTRDLINGAIADVIPAAGPMLGVQPGQGNTLQKTGIDSSAVQAKIVDAYKRGNYAEALRHIPGLIPIVGPSIDAMGDEAQAGNVGAALGDAAAFGVTNVLPGSPVLTKAIKRGVQVLPQIRNPNAVVAAAVARNPELANAATATGNRFVRAGQAVVDHTPIGSIVAENAQQAGAARFTERLQGIADDVHPNPITAEQSGLAGRAEVQGVIEKEHGVANEHYSALRETEADPANVRTVQVGTKEVPILDAQSNPTGRTRHEPVMEDMPAPVDLRIVQKQLKPIYDQITRNMSISKRRMSDGLLAIENIMNARWHEPASIIDADLGVIKAAARGADLPELKSLSQGLAAHAVKALDEQVQAAVGRLKAYDDAPQTAAPAATPPTPKPAATPATVQAGAAPPIGTTDTRVTVPGENQSYQAKYEVRELDDVKASHKGENFEPNTKYELRNERNYNNAENQQKVVDWSTEQQFDPGYHITDNPDAVNGPLVLDSRGNVLGGNGRKMILDRVFKTGKEGAGKYRASLEAKAGQFGIDPATIKGMKQPVLVRVIDDAEFAAGGKTKANAINDFQKTGTAALTPAERAIADSQRVSTGTLDHLAGQIEAKGVDGTLAQALEGKAGTDVLQKLIDDKVITPQERAAFATADGLTPAGKARISELMTGRFFKDPAQLDSIAPSVRGKIERIAAPAATTEAKGAWSLTPHIQDALEIVQSAKAQGVTLAEYFQQGGLLGEQAYNPRAVTLAKHLEGMKPTELTAKVRQYAQDAAHAEGGANLFGEPPTPGKSFADAFGGDAASYADEAAPARNGPKFGNMADFDAPSPLPPPRATKSVGAESLAQLKEGRAATVRKYAASDVFKKMSEEGKGVFDRAFWQKDAGIGELRKQAALVTPEQMAKYGRAKLEEIIETATKEGGFAKVDGIARAWGNIGKETKKLVYKNPMLIQALDDVFLLAKENAKSANSSHSALVGTLVAGVGYLIKHPVTGAPMLMAAGALSKLLYSPKFVQAMQDGMRVRLSSRAQGVATFDRIAKIAGADAKPITPEQAAQLQEQNAPLARAANQ